MQSAIRRGLSGVPALGEKCREVHKAGAEKHGTNAVRNQGWLQQSWGGGLPGERTQLN